MSKDDSKLPLGDDISAWFADDQRWPSELSSGLVAFRSQTRKDPYYGASPWVEEPTPGYSITWQFPRNWRPKVVIHPIVQARTRMWMEAAAPYEVGWSLACALDTFGNIHLFEADLPGQDVWPTEYKIRKEDFAEQAQRWIEENGGDCLPFMKGVGHSHVRMPVFASAQDEDDEEGNLSAYRHLPWAIQQILNLDGEMLHRIHLFGAGLKEGRDWGYPVIENPEVVYLDPMALPEAYLEQYTSELRILKEKSREEVKVRLRRWDGREKVEHGKIDPSRLAELRRKVAKKGGTVEVEETTSSGKLAVTVRYFVTSLDGEEPSKPSGLLSSGIALPEDVFGSDPSLASAQEAVLDTPFEQGGRK